MPDILLLPQLASFFDVTVDALLGYEPQLTKEQIKSCYHKLAADFANNPFEEVMAESERLVKKYYSCYSFLGQICVLWLNHFMMAETPERRQEILDGIAGLCGHIMENCKDISICNNAVSMKAMVDIQSGRTKEVIESLADAQDANRYEGKEQILVQAYLMTGNLDAAEKAAQVNLYQNVLGAFGSGTQLLIIHMRDEAVCEEILGRMDALVDAFDMENLHPNAVAGYQYQAAVCLCMQQKEEEAYRRLHELWVLL